MKRSEARESLMQMLYQMNIHKDYSEEMKTKIMTQYEISEAQQDYFHQGHQLVVNHMQEIDEVIDAASSNWKVSRISKIDVSILRLSAAEILFMDDVPDSASINEAVELAKKYGEDKSSKFINGILGKISRDKNNEQ